MPKIIVTFSDTAKEDQDGNPVVDIDTVSTPKFPDDSAEPEKLFSPAQKAAISFLRRGAQQGVADFLRSIHGEALKMQNAFAELAEKNESGSPALPFDFRLLELQVKEFVAYIESSIGAYE